MGRTEELQKFSLVSSLRLLTIMAVELEMGGEGGGGGSWSASRRIAAHFEVGGEGASFRGG